MAESSTPRLCLYCRGVILEYIEDGTRRRCPLCHRVVGVVFTMPPAAPHSDQPAAT